METWKPIEGTDGLIEVSSEGRVRSLLRNRKILKQQEDPKGYLRVTTTVHRVKKTFKVHRAVAQAFIENPEGLPQVNHIDGNKKNNSVSNLEWISNQGNAQHAIKRGLWENVFAASKKENDSRKIAIVSIDSTSGEKRHFESVSQAERFFGSRHISDVLNGKRKRAAGQYFKREVVAWAISYGNPSRDRLHS